MDRDLTALEGPTGPSEPLHEAKGLTDLLAECRSITTEASQRRRELVRQLLAAGMTMRQLGTALGISATEVYRLAKTAQPTESKEER